MPSYLTKAIGQARKPLGAGTVIMRRVQRGTPNAPTAVAAAEVPAQTQMVPVVSVPQPEAQRPPGLKADVEQPARRVEIPHGLRVQRIVTPVPSAPTVTERVVARMELREKQVVEAKEVVREAVRPAVGPTTAPTVQEWVEVREESMPAAARALVAPPKHDISQIPLSIELPRSAPSLPADVQRQVEKEVTRVVRERVRNTGLPKSASSPERLEVRIDQVNVRVENPPAPQPAAAVAPAPSGFADYFLARTVSR
ncbi:hypothetical protein [uncultured Paludibaculum sp.]|uniref:hypothetical protein n=1 Tax=uncultured Paludibaculum sp. TaxID=1765020 RepID=UPI002AAC0696|nr:hypothetical protein [uncultured Paludibaculum sp.]